MKRPAVILHLGRLPPALQVVDRGCHIAAIEVQGDIGSSLALGPRELHGTLPSESHCSHTAEGRLASVSAEHWDLVACPFPETTFS